MKPFIRLRLIPLMALCAIATSPAWAQNASTDRLQKGPIVTGTGQPRAPRAAPPPGLPGAATGRDRVAPADRAATDMQPTDALFDSINRGDITGARDALSRGADYNARNVLGLTPLDQSIDLSRNDITFLLLSLRGASPAQVQSAPVSTKVGKEPKPAPRPVAQQAPPRAGAQAQNARQLPPPRNGDTGTPNPQSGFLGFGG